MRPRNLLASPAGSRPVRWSRRNKAQQAGGRLEMTDTRRPPAAEDRPLVPCGGSETLLSPASLPGFWRLLLAPPACGTDPPPPGVCRLFLEDGVRSAASFLLCEGRGRVASRAPWRASVSPETAAGLAHLRCPEERVPRRGRGFWRWARSRKRRGDAVFSPAAGVNE